MCLVYAHARAAVSSRVYAQKRVCAQRKSGGAARGVFECAAVGCLLVLRVGESFGCCAPYIGVHVAACVRLREPLSRVRCAFADGRHRATLGRAGGARGDGSSIYVLFVEKG